MDLMRPTHYPTAINPLITQRPSGPWRHTKPYAPNVTITTSPLSAPPSIASLSVIQKKHQGMSKPNNPNPWQYLLQDLLMPMVVMGAVLGVGVLSFRSVEKWLQRQKTRDSLKGAIRKLSGYPTVEAALKSYSPSVQQSVKRFLGEEYPALIFKGPPGNGKSYLLDTVAQHLSQQSNHSKNSLVLNAQNADVRQIIHQLYAGTTLEAEQSLRLLNRLHQKPVNQIILTINELENASFEIQELIKTALGNTDAMKQIHRSPRWQRLFQRKSKNTQPLPALKILGSANQEITFDGAALNRIRSESLVWVDHKPPELLADVLAQLLNKKLKLSNISQADVQSLLKQTPGVSTRQMTVLVDSLKAPQKEAALKELAEKLNHTVLDGYELAALSRQWLIQALSKQTKITLPEDTLSELSQTLWEKSEKQATERTKTLRKNGGDYIRLFQSAWDTLKDKTEAIYAIKGRGSDRLTFQDLKLNKDHLAALIEEFLKTLDDKVYQGG